MNIKLEVLSWKISRSVIAVPPLARRPDLSLNEPENRKLIDYLISGGVRTLLYGGNANFYHVGPREFRAILEFLSDAVPEDVWVIPSVGPAFGNMMEQAEILRDYEYETAMVLPATFPLTQEGVELGVRQFCETSELQVVLYLKQENYLAPDQVSALVRDGCVSAIKYAIVRDDPAEDPYLKELVGLVDPRRIISGIGEQPAITHLRQFGFGGFTSGCVCLAPIKSMLMLSALDEEDYEEAEGIRRRFAALEDLRNSHGPIPVLHEAVRLAGVADMGPMLPLMTNLPESLWALVQSAALELKQYNDK